MVYMLRPNGWQLTCGNEKPQVADNGRSPITVTHEVCFHFYNSCWKVNNKNTNPPQAMNFASFKIYIALRALTFLKNVCVILERRACLDRYYLTNKSFIVSVRVNVWNLQKYIPLGKADASQVTVDAPAKNIPSFIEAMCWPIKLNTCNDPYNWTGKFIVKVVLGLNGFG